MARAKLKVESLESRTVCSVSPGPYTTHGGPVISHVKVEMIFYGDFWSTKAGKDQAYNLRQATNDLIGGSYMDRLAKFGVGRGCVDQVDFMPTSSFGNDITYKATKIVTRESGPQHLGTNRLPGPENNTLYVTIGGPNVKT